MAELSKGAIRAILNGASGATFTLQVLGISELQAPEGQGPGKLRMVISDGEASHGEVLASQQREMVTSGELKEGCIVEVDDYTCNNVQGRKIVILLSMAVAQSDAPIVGHPTRLDAARSDQCAQPLPGGATGPTSPAPRGGGYAMPPSAPYGAPSQETLSLSSLDIPSQGAMPGSQPQAGLGAQGRQGAGAGASGGPHQGGRAPMSPAGQPPTTPARQPQGGARRPVARDEVAAGAAAARPIASLNPWLSRWAVKARVTSKSDMRRFSNQRGEGKFFTFDLLDAEGGEIRVYGWNTMCDRFYDSVEVGRVYTLSRATLRSKKGTYNQCGQHRYEIHLDSNSQLEQCMEEEQGAGIPRIRYAFRPIADLRDAPLGQMVDVVGVVDSVWDWAAITRRDGSEAHKRSLMLRDSSDASIELTLWGACAHDPGDALHEAVVGHERHPVLAVKGARVGEFNGKNLSTVGSSTVAVDPLDIPEAVRERNWYDQGGRVTQVEGLSNRSGSGGGRADRRVFLRQIGDEGLGLRDRPMWVQVAAECTWVKHDSLYYPACSLQRAGRPCHKKMQDSGGGYWFCSECNSGAEPVWRYHVSLRLEDHTGSVLATAFDETAKDLLGGVTAGQLKEMADDGNQPAVEEALQAPKCRPMVFKLKLKEDYWQDEQRLSMAIAGVDLAPDLAAECQITLGNIHRLKRGEPIILPGPQPQQQWQQQQPHQQWQQHDGGFFGVASSLQHMPVLGLTLEQRARTEHNRQAALEQRAHRQREAQQQAQQDQYQYQSQWSQPSQPAWQPSQASRPVWQTGQASQPGWAPPPPAQLGWDAAPLEQPSQLTPEQQEQAERFGQAALQRQVQRQQQHTGQQREQRRRPPQPGPQRRQQQYLQVPSDADVIDLT